MTVPIGALVGGIAALVAIPAIAQEARFNCDFQRICQIGILCSGDRLNIEFAYNRETAIGEVFGNQGSNEVVVLQGSMTGRAVTFVEPLLAGAAQSTTIANTGNALHSRHTLIGETFAPSQYSGTCTMENWP